MKVNLECGSDLRNGYVNISSWPVENLPNDLPEKTSLVVGNSGNLDPVLDNDSVEEMIFCPSLNIIRPNDIMPVLGHWRNKLKKNGVMKVNFVDVRLVARDIYSGSLNLQQIHSVIFGPNKQNENVMDTDVITSVLKSLGLKVESVARHNYVVMLEVRK